jgi:hypothetical protein
VAGQGTPCSAIEGLGGENHPAGPGLRGAAPGTTKPEVVAMAKRLRRKGPKRGQRSLRVIAAELAAAGHLNERGAPYSPKTIASMLN